MALGETRRYYRMEALTVAAELIRQHGGTNAMDNLPEAEADVFNQECHKLAEQLEAKADKLGYSGHGDIQPRIDDISESLT
jgi:hypothetical protein